MNVVKTFFPKIPGDHDSHGHFVMTVLTQDATGLYACYIGMVTITDPTSVEQRDNCAQWVAHSGEKLGWERSRAYFDVPETLYRR